MTVPRTAATSRKTPDGSRGTIRDESGTDPRSGKILVSKEYMARVAWLEALPENQSGADKTWVESALSEFRDHFASASRAE